MFTSDPSANDAAHAGRHPVRQDPLRPLGTSRDRSLIPAAGSGSAPLSFSRSLRNARLLILATTLLGIGLALALALATPQRYAATAQLIIDPGETRAVASEATPAALPSDAATTAIPADRMRALIESQTALIMSDAVLSRVIEEAGLADDPEFDGRTRTSLATPTTGMGDLLAGEAAESANAENHILQRVRDALTVGHQPMSYVFDVTVESTDPVKAARLANLTASVFVEERGRVPSDAARPATTALSSHLSKLRQTVVDAERAVDDFKSRNTLVDAAGRFVDDPAITRADDESTGAGQDIEPLRVRDNATRGASVEDVVTGTLPEEPGAEALVRLRQTYSDLEQEAAVLAVRLGPRHPQRIANEVALVAAREAIASELSRIDSAAQTERARAEGTGRSPAAQNDEPRSAPITTSGSFAELRKLEREVDASRAVHEAFLLWAREVGDQEGLRTTDVRVISQAAPPQRPVGMSRELFVAAGGVLGLGIGLCIAALWAVPRSARDVFTRGRRVAPEGRWPDPGPDGPTDGVPWVPDASAKIYQDASPRPAPPDSHRPIGEEIGGEAGMNAAAATSEGDPPRTAGSSHDDLAFGEPRDDVPDRAMATEPHPDHLAVAPYQDPPRVNGPGLAGTSSVADDIPIDEPSEDRALGVPAVGATTETQETGPADIAARLAGDLTLAQVARGEGARVESHERLSLRERVRALSATATQTAGHGTAANGAVDPEAALLHDEIQTVKQAIADIRRRRETKAPRS